MTVDAGGIMKRLISILLALSTLFLVSCGAPKKFENKAAPFASATYHRVIEAPSRVLLADAKLYYYSKADGESYPFCFNPLCQHTFNENCPSVLFGGSKSVTGQMVYCDETGRFFFARGQKIYSMSFDASDIKLECSLGEDGDVSQKMYDKNLIKSMRSYGQYVYFMFTNAETGHAQILRLDSKTSKLKEMTSGETEWVIAYEIADGYVYFKMTTSDNLMNYYTADLDFNNKKVISDPVYPSDALVIGLYDGKWFYERTPEGLVKFDPLTEEKVLVSDDPEFLKFAQILAVNERGVYFTYDEIKNVGKEYISAYGEYRDVFLSGTKIGVLQEDGVIEEVFDLKTGEAFSINFIDGGVVVYCTAMYIESTDGALKQKPNVFVLFDTDENGNFINPRPIGNCADDTELIEYLKGL